MVDSVLGILAGLAGLGSLVSMLVNFLKMLGVVKDGTSQTWVNGFNLVAFVAVAVVVVFNLPVEWSTVDTVLGFLATFFGLVIQLFGSKFAYSVTRGLPVIGFSFNTD